MSGGPTSDLPVHDLADVRLADRLSGPACPVCAGRDEATGAWLRAAVHDGATDRAFRKRLDDSRGLCPTHVHELLATNRRETGVPLSSAILFGAMLRRHSAELEAAAQARGRRRSRAVAAAAIPPACPACAEGDAAEARTLDQIAALVTRDPAWSQAASRAPLCLPHIAALLQRDLPGPAGSAAIDGQLARVRGLLERLEGYVHHSSHDRRADQTDAERAAVAEAAALLGGLR